MRTLRSFWVSILAVAVVACSAGNSEKPSATADEGVAVELQRLRDLHGSFEASTVGAGGYQLPAAETVYRALATHGHDAVRELVSCLDDEAPSSVQLNGRAVPLGVLCGQALLYVAHFEATDSVGGVDAAWPGYLLPEDGFEKRKEAKRVWVQVVSERRYVLRSEM